MSNPNRGQPAGNNAARRAAQQRQEDQGRVQAAMQRNRQQPPPITSSGGVELPTPGVNGRVVVETYTLPLERVGSIVINRYEDLESGTPFEFVVDGEVLMTGVGTLSDALLEFAILLDEGRPDTPHD